MSRGLWSLFPGTKQRVEDKKRQKPQQQRKTQHYTFRMAEGRGWESVIQLLAGVFLGVPWGLYFPSLSYRYPALDLPEGSSLGFLRTRSCHLREPVSVFLLDALLYLLHSVGWDSMRDCCGLGPGLWGYARCQMLLHLGKVCVGRPPKE